MAECSLQYVKFMAVREFYVTDKLDGLRVADVKKIEKAIDGL